MFGCVWYQCLCRKSLGFTIPCFQHLVKSPQCEHPLIRGGWGGGDLGHCKVHRIVMKSETVFDRALAAVWLLVKQQGLRKSIICTQCT
jgi:hypothetical protein